MKIFSSLFAIALATSLMQVVSPASLTPLEVSVGIEAAQARRSGGRSSGGSFSRPRSGGSGGSRSNSSPSRSSGSGSNNRTAPSRNSPTSGSSGNTNRGNTGGATRGGSFSRPTAPAPRATVAPSPVEQRDFTPPNRNYDRGSGGGTVIVPVPLPYNNAPTQPPPQSPAVTDTAPPASGTTTDTDVRPAQSSSSQRDDGGGLFFGFLILLLIAAGLIFFVLRLMKGRSGGSGDELDNDIVTVSKLQIGLLASAKTLQAQLTRLSEEADLDSPDGLAAFSAECSLALLRKPDYWVYGASTSETVDSREAAQKLFESISIGERVKFDTETFSRSGDRIAIDDSSDVDPDEEPAEYIVVTLVAGTEGDRPLFAPVTTADDLEAALKTIGSLTGDYLSVFELLWTPQTAEDSLTADELIELYPDVTPIA